MPVIGDNEDEKFILTVTGIVPYFNQAPISYVEYPTLVDAYIESHIQVREYL